MDILNVLVGVTAIFWIAAGIKTHSDWIQSIFVNESKKIRQQTEIISEFGYGALNTRNTLEVKKGLVFAYWDKPIGKQKIAKNLELYVVPEKRGGKAGLMMMKNFISFWLLMIVICILLGYYHGNLIWQ